LNEHAAPPEIDIMEAPEQRSIVLIDDDADLRRTMQELLANSKYTIVATGDPREAISLVRKVDPVLILSDIEMPEMSGYDVLRELQSDPETARYPVMFITAHQEFSERVRAFRFGVVDYVTKPFTRQILLRKIERVIESLDRRSGEVSGSGVEAHDLIEDLRRDARTGVLTITGEKGQERVVLQAGKSVEGVAPPESVKAIKAEFCELNPITEEIVSHEPTRLSGEAASIPSFTDLPEILRVVLIVDDNDDFRSYMARLFKTNGLRVFEASDGEEALEIALREHPWLVITDTRMPKMDGFEFCRSIRAHSFIRNTPVVFLSGWDDYKDRCRAMELGANDFFSKTFSVRELLMRIHLILSRFAQVDARSRRGMRGGIETLGTTGLMQLCHLTRLTGRLSVRSGARHIDIRFRSGEIVHAESDELQGTEAVYELLSWTRGYFEFQPEEGGNEPPLGKFTEIILAGCRRLDEKPQR
jgi:DNA-binding response OmpR family regulator